MEEYKIDENTTYIDDGSLKIIKYAKQDDQSLVVKFRENNEDIVTEHLGDCTSSTYFRVNAEIYTEKPIKGEEKQTEEKKLSKFEKAKNKLLSKILAKKSNSNNSEATTPKETFSKEVLFNKDLYNPNRTLDDFLANPIQLEPEYKSINKILESARQTIITDGYRLKKEADKVRLEQLEAKYAKEDKAASAKRSALDNDVARKLKGFER